VSPGEIQPTMGDGKKKDLAPDQREEPLPMRRDSLSAVPAREYAGEQIPSGGGRKRSKMTPIRGPIGPTRGGSCRRRGAHRSWKAGRNIKRPSPTEARTAEIGISSEGRAGSLAP